MHVIENTNTRQQYTAVIDLSGNEAAVHKGAASIYLDEGALCVEGYSQNNTLILLATYADGVWRSGTLEAGE